MAGWTLSVPMPVWQSRHSSASSAFSFQPLAWAICTCLACRTAGGNRHKLLRSWPGEPSVLPWSLVAGLAGLGGEGGGVLGQRARGDKQPEGKGASGQPDWPDVGLGWLARLHQNLVFGQPTAQNGLSGSAMAQRKADSTRCRRTIPHRYRIDSLPSHRLHGLNFVDFARKNPRVPGTSGK